MALKTKDQLKAYWNANIIKNDKGLITGNILNTAGIDLIDSLARQGSTYYVPNGDVTLVPEYDNGTIVWGSNADDEYNVIIDNTLPAGYTVHIVNAHSFQNLYVQGAVPADTPIPGYGGAWLFWSGVTWFLYIFEHQIILQGYGGVYDDDEDNFSVQANTWTQLDLSAASPTELYNTTETIAGLKINSTTNTQTVMTTVHGSLSLDASSSSTIRFSYFINGASSAYTNAFAVIRKAAVGSYFDLDFHAVFSAETGTEINLAVYSDKAQTLDIIKKGLTIEYKSV